MKRAAFLPLCLAVLTFCQVGRANITSVVWQGTGGALSDVVYSTTGPQGDITGGWMYAGQGGNGQMGLSLGTDSPTDPAFTLTTDLINSSGFTWSSYLVDVSMTTGFTFSGVANNIPGDWTAIVQNPGAPVAGVYTGHLIFYAGTPIGDGGEFNFVYTVNFDGGPSISFTETLTPVPEPGTLSLLAIGSALFVIARRRR
jgi:hypothetical protein